MPATRRIRAQDLHVRSDCEVDGPTIAVRFSLTPPPAEGGDDIELMPILRWRHEMDRDEDLARALPLGWHWYVDEDAVGYVPDVAWCVLRPTARDLIAAERQMAEKGVLVPRQEGDYATMRQAATRHCAFADDEAEDRAIDAMRRALAAHLTRRFGGQ